MSIQMLYCRGAGILLAVLAAGCSSTQPGATSSATSNPASTASPSRANDECKPNRRGCLYKGAYESGERGYAEQEAKRLNMAELERLRRSFGQ